MYGITGAVIAASYVLRAVGDVGNGALSWLSPIGWGQAMHGFSGERWWPALISVAAVVVLTAAALQLFARRDIGAGLWPARPGPEQAGRWLHGSFGLAWRLQRGSLIGWAAGLFFIGLAYGAIGDDVKDLIGDSQFSTDVFGQGGGSLVDSFYAAAALLLALMAAGFSISSVLRPRTEEADGRVESLLATALPRWRWALVAPGGDRCRHRRRASPRPASGSASAMRPSPATARLCRGCSGPRCPTPRPC